MRFIEGERVRQHLDGDATAQRFLHGLVDDSHSAAAHLANNAEIPQASQLFPAFKHDRFRRSLLLLADVFQNADRGKQFANGVGQVGMFRDVFVDGGPLAAAAARDILGGQDFDRMPIRL